MYNAMHMYEKWYVQTLQLCSIHIAQDTHDLVEWERESCTYTYIYVFTFVRLYLRIFVQYVEAETE